MGQGALRATAALAAAGLALAACAAAPERTVVRDAGGPPGPDACGARSLADLIGAPWDPAARARVGARPHRAVRPGDAVTMDYRADRLTIELDASGRIARMTCG